MMERSRRQFLQLGGAGALATLLLGACTDSNDRRNDSGSSAPPTTRPTSTPTSAAVIDDGAILRTAASLEALAIAAYGAIQSIGLVKNGDFLDVGRIHADHHQHHLDEINDRLTQAGGRPYSTPNTVMQETLVEPVLTHPRLAEADLVTMASRIESTLAQLYAYAAGAFTTPALRASGMSIGAVEARHVVVIAGVVLKGAPESLVQTSFAATDNPLPPAAFVAG